jgi:hypothetical protein
MAGRVRASRTVKTRKDKNRQEQRNKCWHISRNNWQQTSREHRYKYIGDNGEDGQHLEGGGDKHKDR